MTKVIDLELETLYNQKPIEVLNEEFLKENSTQLESLIECAKVMYLLDPISNQNRAINLVTSLSENLSGRSLKVFFIIYFI